jgi:para-nitrobenzyl esterase
VSWRLPAERVAALQARHNESTYAYQFAWEAQNPEFDLGAFHAIDLPFVFDTFDVAEWHEFLGVDEGAREVGKTMRSAFASFARTGNPSCAATGVWPKFEAERRQTMILKPQPEVADDPLGADRALFREFGEA